MKLKILLLFWLVSANVTEVFAQSPLKDPGIPSNESIRYKVVAEKNTEYYSEKTDFFSEDDQGYYRMITTSQGKKTEVRFLKSSMEALYFASEIEASGHLISEQRQVTLKSARSADEIRLVDFSALAFSLRGYPFEKPWTLKIKIFGEEPQSEKQEEAFSMSVKYVKKEVITIEKRKYDCYRLELVINLSGPMALFGGFIPKTYLWYSTEAPHYLVKFQGGGGPGGSENRVVTLENYSVN